MYAFFRKKKALVFANDDTGILALRRELKHFGVKRVVLEATGGLEYAAARALADAELAVERVQPGRMRAFRKVLGKRAKSDPIDSRLHARFALAMPEEGRPIPSRQAEAMRSLGARRRQLVDLLVQEKTRLKMTRDPVVLQSLKTTIALLKQERSRIEGLLESELGKDLAMQRRNVLLRSIPGIGAVVATTLITDLPELGELNRHQAASLAGLAPHPDRSGTTRSGDHIGGGRSCVRTALYMAAVCAVRCNPPLRTFYRRLVAEGKPHKVAIIGVARKLVVLANTLIKSNMPFDPQRAQL
jgi:transposase